MKDLLDYIVILKWYRFGLELGISDTELNMIKDKKKEDAKGALQEIFQFVLTTNPDLTWENVVNALRKIGENRTARIVDDKFCRNS